MACYFGYKNFSVKTTIIGIVLAVGLVHIGFYLLGNYLKNRFDNKALNKIKTVFEYALIVFVAYYVFY